jgi:hypothetical protein
MQVPADDYTTKWAWHFRPLQQMEQENVEKEWKDPEGYQQKSRVPQHTEVVATKMLVTMLWCLLVLSLISYSTVAGSVMLTQVPSRLFYLAYVCSVLSLKDFILFLLQQQHI